MYIFISHSSKEAGIANELLNAIETAGNRCFIAPRDIRLGHEYAEEIANGIDSVDAVLLLLSEASNNSPHVLREIERAVSKGIPVLVYKLGDVRLTKSMEYFLMTRQWMEAGKDSYADVVACIHNLECADGKSGQNEKNHEKPKQEKPRQPVIKKATRKRPLLLAGMSAVVLVIAALLVMFLLPDKSFTDIALGDTVIMGKYNGQDMYWRVLNISDDGKDAVLVARDVISVKAFDAPDSGRYNHDGEENYFFAEEKLASDYELQAYVKGNNSWEKSTIRTWLNSDKETVRYDGQAPVSEAMAEGVNGYSSEEGFLCSFSKKELEAIKVTKVETKGNVLSGTDMVVTEDKVFLLSLKELDWFSEANVSMLCVPTEEAVEKNQTFWYRDYCLDYGVENMMWWLREPASDSSSECYLVGNGYKEDNIYTWETGVESFGIRPAMTIDLTKAEIKVH